MSNNFSDILNYSANRFPDHIAVIDGDKSISYEELNFNVYSIAHSFLDMGLESGDRIVSLLPNCIENVITNFAAAKIWCTLVPLGTMIGASELAEILAQTKPKIMVADASTAALAGVIADGAFQDTRIIRVGKAGEGSLSFDDLVERYSRLEVPYPEGRKDKLCSIIYTSGTSGRKKGVMRTHENNLWSLISITINRQYKPHETELFVLPMHTIAFYNVFCPNLLCGSTVLLQREFDRGNVLSLIERYSVNRLYLLPFMWNAVISDARFAEYDLSSLKQLMVGATPISIEAKLRIMRAFPDAELYESWGMSEGGHLALEPSDNLRKMGSIGKSLCFDEMKIVDEHGYKVPPGMVGEIIIRGKSVTAGYFENPEETERSFPDGDDWFHTGDLARYDEEGYFYLSGRKSEIIYYGDNKIHPQEIEEALLMDPEISEAAVLGYPDERWGEIAVAAVTRRPGSGIDESNIYEVLEKYIAGYKKPKHILFLDEIPKSALGKIDKKRLVNDIARILKAK